MHSLKWLTLTLLCFFPGLIFAQGGDQIRSLIFAEAYQYIKCVYKQDAASPITSQRELSQVLSQACAVYRDRIESLAPEAGLIDQLDQQIANKILGSDR